MPTGPLAIPALNTPLDATWRVPGSKSITNRAFVLAALSPHTALLGVLESDDTKRMRECLAEYGVKIRDVRPGAVDVEGGIERLHVPKRPMFVGNSGTTVRFLAGLAALVPGPSTFVGDEHMAKRPISDLVDGLRQLGLTVDCPTGCPPLTIYGGKILGQRVVMSGEKSSQYFTALLLSSGMFDVDLDIAIEGELVSRPYIDMTISMVHDFDGRIESTENGFRTFGRRRYNRKNHLISGIPAYRIEPDASSASYPFALAAVTGSRIQVPGLNKSSLQGDIRFAEILVRAGAEVEYVNPPQTTSGFTETPSTLIAGPKQMKGIDVDMHHISDTVMTLAAIAPLCDGPTTIRNVANIRIKETDRLAATVNELRRVGQLVEHGDDWLKITPRPLKPATIECYSDHRMAMSFAVLAAAARDSHWDPSVPTSERQIRIADPACTAKTYPGFWDDLAKLYPQKPW